LGWVGSIATRERCWTFSPRCASPSTPSPATSRMLSWLALASVCVALRLTAVTTPPMNSLHSGENALHHLAGDVGQPHVAAAEPVGQPLVVDAQQVQHGRVQVVHLHLVLDRVEAVLVSGAVDHAPLDAAAGQPHREAVGAVIPAGGVAL